MSPENQAADAAAHQQERELRAVAQQHKRNRIYLFKRDFNKGEVRPPHKLPQRLTVALIVWSQGETLGLPMHQTVIEFVNATADDPTNRAK